MIDDKLVRSGMITNVILGNEIIYYVSRELLLFMMIFGFRYFITYMNIYKVTKIIFVPINIK